MTAETYVALEAKAEATIASIRKGIEAVRRKVRIPARSRLRPAVASDIVIGAIIYHLRTRGLGLKDYWHVIDSVQHPNDDFKAYTAEDGCRYGLYQAFVRKERP